MSARSTLHPRRNLSPIVVEPIPVMTAHSSIVLRSPRCSRKRDDRLLFACSIFVAHLQLSFEYPRLLFLRSNDIPTGFVPMSFKNVTNPDLPSHSSHTVIPRPPYRGYACALWLVQRSTMLFHVLYSMVCPSKCVPWIFVGVSFRRQPHDFTEPDRRCDNLVDFSLPHEQRHTIRSLTPVDSSIVRRPNFWPMTC